MTYNLIFTEQDFLSLFNLPKVSFDEFCSQIQILDYGDKSGTFKVKQDLDSFILRVSKRDDRLSRLLLFKQKLYQILVKDIQQTLASWFNNQGKLKKNIEFYFNIPKKDILSNGVFAGRTNATDGRICKNINFVNY